MKAKRSPVETLIGANCDSILTANAILLRGSRKRFHEESAQATLDSLEEVTLNLINGLHAYNEYIQQKVSVSGSLRLAQHLYDITGKRLTLEAAQWSVLLKSINADRLRQLTSGPIAPTNMSMELIRQIGQGCDDFIPLIAEVAFLDSSPSLSDIFHREAPIHAAQLLKLQADRLPIRFHQMAIEAARQMAVDSLALLFLLGVEMPRPDESFGEGTQFLDTLSSKHGQMFARATLGTVSQFLADHDRHKRSARVSKYAAPAHH